MEPQRSKRGAIILIVGLITCSAARCSASAVILAASSRARDASAASSADVSSSTRPRRAAASLRTCGRDAREHVDARLSGYAP